MFNLKYILNTIVICPGVPWWLRCKESACNAGDPGLIPGSGRSPGEGNGNPLWDSCLGNYMDRGAWWAPVHGVTKSQRRLSDFHLMLMCPRISQSLCSYLSPSSSKSISKRWQREEPLIQQWLWFELQTVTWWAVVYHSGFLYLSCNPGVGGLGPLVKEKRLNIHKVGK